MSLDAAVDAVLTAAGADAAEAFAQDVHVRERRWANGELAEERRRHESGLAVRVRRRGRIGLAAASGRFDVPDLMSRARTAAVVGPGYPSRFAGGTAAFVTPIDDEDRHPGPPDEAAVARLAARLRERHRDISSTIAVIETRETRRIRTTEGVDEHDGRSFVMLRVTVSRSDNGEVLDLAFEAPCDMAGATLDAALARLDDRLRWTGRTATAGNRDLPVVLTPRALAALVVEPLGEALSGPALVEG
ncbi:MAG TPA: hypothetical protein VFN57_16185, partial [Thermomicrobiaceae bacterium]|nr:hypothetical protein [Thermomicrobiaceae bacterium]